MDEMAYSAKLPSETYDPDTGVLHREYSHLKEYVAPITDAELKNPHIKFFVEQNPGWMKVLGKLFGREGGRGGEGSYFHHHVLSTLLRGGGGGDIFS